MLFPERLVLVVVINAPRTGLMVAHVHFDIIIVDHTIGPTSKNCNTCMCIRRWRSGNGLHSCPNVAALFHESLVNSHHLTLILVDHCFCAGNDGPSAGCCGQVRRAGGRSRCFATALLTSRSLCILAHFTQGTQYRTQPGGRESRLPTKYLKLRVRTPDTLAAPF